MVRVTDAGYGKRTGKALRPPVALTTAKTPAGVGPSAGPDRAKIRCQGSDVSGQKAGAEAVKLIPLAAEYAEANHDPFYRR
jgi:hypothetical protein